MRAFFALVVVALAVLAVASPASAANVVANNSLVLSTSAFNNVSCHGMAQLGQASSISLTDALTGATSSCPDIAYPSLSAPANTSGEIVEGLALNLAAIDPFATPTDGRLYVVEGLATTGKQVLAYSPLKSRATVTRLPLAASTIAIAMGLRENSATPTPVLLLTSSPMGLRRKNVVTGVETELLTEAHMENTINMTHAVAGALVVNDVAQEAYWIGLSGFTPLLPDGSLNAAALKLYALNLVNPPASPTPKEVALTNLPDVLSVHFSASLNALIFVTSTDVRVASLPAVPGSLSASALTQLTPVVVFTYASQWSTFDSLQTSSAWIAEAQQLVLGIVLQPNAGHFDEKIVVITFGKNAGVIQKTGPIRELAVAAGSSLPLFFTGAVSQLAISSVPASVGLNAPSVTVDGWGFAQALVVPSLKCVWGGVNTTVAVQVAHANSGAEVRVSCPLPAGLPANTQTLRLRLTAVNGLVQSQEVEIDVDECAPGAPAVCTTAGMLNCTNTRNGFTCLPTPVDPGSCPAGHGVPPACALCEIGSYKAVASAAECTKCAVTKTTDTTGSTSEAQCKDMPGCDLKLVEGTGEGGLGAVTDGGANVPVRLRMRVLKSVEEWAWDAAANALEFREGIAVQLGLYNADGTPDTRRIGPVESVVRDEWLPDMASIVTFSILPANWDEQEACRNGTATGNTGVSPGGLGGKLVGTPGSNVTVVLDKLIAPPASKMSMALCIDNSMPGLAALGALLVLTGMVYCVASMKPRLPRSRPWEVFPAMLPLIAVGYDVWFVTKLNSLDPAVNGALLTPIVMAVAIVLLVAGVALNAATIMYYAAAQTKKASVLPVTLRMTAEGEVKKSIHVGSTPGAMGQGPSVLNMWRQATPTASQVAFVAGALNVNALGLCSSRLTSRHAVWHIKFDRHRSNGVGYHALLRKAGFRAVLVRQLPMILLQAVMVMMLDCPLWAAAPLIAGVLALVAVLGRLMYVTTEEPAVSDMPVGGKYVLRQARRQGPDGNWVESDNGNGAEYVETDSSEGSRNSRTSSRSGWARAGSLAGGLRKGPGEDEEGHYKMAASPQLASTDDMNAAAGLPHMPMEVGADGMVEMEMTAEEEAELAAAGLNAHSWQLVDNIDNQLEGGGLFARYKRRMNHKDAEAVMARRARVNAQAALARKAEAVPAEVVQRTMAAAKEAREVASNAHIWLLFDEPSISASGDKDTNVIAPLPKAVGPDQVVRAVEVFHPETGLPYSPAMFKRYVAQKSAVEKVAEARKAEAAKPEVVARVEKAKAIEAEIASEADVWIMLDDSKEAAAGESLEEHGSVDIKEIEVFTEEGTPYNPAFFKRFVKKVKAPAPVVLHKEGEPAAPVAAVDLPVSPKKSPSPPSTGRKRLAPLSLASPSEAQDRINARAAESEAHASAASAPRKESLSTKGHDSTSQSAESAMSANAHSWQLSEPGAIDREAEKEAQRVEINNAREKK